MLYFDNNATTALGHNALSSYEGSLLEDWSNPSSPYRAGSRVRAKLEQAREELAGLFSFKKDQIIFTSGATEANNAIFAHFSTGLKLKGSCLVSPFEHPSVIDSAKYWFDQKIIYMPTDGNGLVNLDKTCSIIETEKISLVSLMAANNETGVLQPWQELAEVCSSNGVYFHCDATQWVGKLDTSGLCTCDSFSASAHKFCGPKGIGWLATKAPVKMQLGGSQEFGLRGGTENYPAIVSMMVALRDAQERIAEVNNRALWRDEFDKGILAGIPNSQILGSGKKRLWNTSMVLLPDYENLRWIGKLDKLGFEVSTGSACSVGKEQGSGIAGHYGLTTGQGRRLVRVSSYFDHSQSDWRKLLSAFCIVYKELLSDSVSSSVLYL